jgi:predicted nuclease of restriction endonuclease-like (RecB) superfamily
MYCHAGFNLICLLICLVFLYSKSSSYCCIKADALEVFKDEYLGDFVASDDCDEKVFEGKLVTGIKTMIMTLGKGFCFIGNQYRLEIEGKEFFVDLLFFNRHLKCLVAFEGVATYRTTKEMPRQMRGILPDVNEIAKLL